MEMESNKLPKHKPIEEYLAWANQQIQLVGIDIGSSRERPHPAIFLTSSERRHIQNQLASQTAKRIDREKTRIAEQMHGMARTIAASQAAPGKAAMIIQPSCRCNLSACI